MELDIKNIGIIAHAKIKLNGLTIIAGENDTGKSFTGKTIFAIIKALKDCQDVNNITELEQNLSRTFYSEFNSSINTPSEQSTISLMKNEENIFTATIQQNKVAKINLYNEKWFKNNIFLRDATLIESPIILQLYEIIHLYSSKPLRSHNIPLHMKDLIEKLETKSCSGKNNYSQEMKDLMAYIENIIQGNICFDHNLNEFKYCKISSEGEVEELRANNSASGIKSFGIINLLLKLTILNQESLLIIDEPETHLHPAWQVQYAKLIAKLVKNNITVLVNTHSPYILQALRVAMQQENITAQTSFYLGEKDAKDGNATLRDVSENVNEIFIKLSEPLQKLVWNQI